VDETANAHSSAVSCSHTTFAPARKSCKQPSSEHTGRALYVLRYDIPPMVTVPSAEERRRDREKTKAGSCAWRTEAMDRC
jgi:hypothetical protein